MKLFCLKHLEKVWDNTSLKTDIWSDTAGCDYLIASRVIVFEFVAYTLTAHSDITVPCFEIKSSADRSKCVCVDVNAVGWLSLVALWSEQNSFWICGTKMLRHRNCLIGVEIVSMPWWVLCSDVPSAVLLVSCQRCSMRLHADDV